MKESFSVDARGLPVTYELTGKSTFGAAMRESFRRENGRATWESRADRGDEPAAEDFVFLPLDGSFAYFDAVVRLLLSRPDAAAPTLGGLTLRAERVLRETLPGPSGPLPLALVAVTGADANPWFFWVRDDGSNAFFAVTWPGWTVIENGFEPLVPPLLERQRVATDQRLVELRRRLAMPLGGLTPIRAVRWFDAPAAVMRGPTA